MKDVEMIRERAPNIIGLNPQQDRTMQVVWKEKNTNVQITGTATNFLEVRTFKMANGVMFTAADDAARRKVAVLDAEVLTLLGVDNGEGMIGEKLRIGGGGVARSDCGVEVRVAARIFSSAPSESVPPPNLQASRAGQRVPTVGFALKGRRAATLQPVRAVQ